MIPLRSFLSMGVALCASGPLVVQAQADTLRPAGPARPPGAYMNVSFVGLATFGWSTADDIRALQIGDHDPRVRGFGIPNAELALDGAIDPFFKGAAYVIHKLDENGETAIELEEMYFLTTSLPWNLQVKGGQFFTEFGRQNPTHPHAWAFADVPLVLGRLLGGEGLRGQGARVSWLAPTPFYTEATFAVLNSAGGTTAGFRSEESTEIHGGVPIEREVKGAKDMLYIPRLAASFDLTGAQTLLVGASGAFGPNNTGPDAQTRILGADLYWKWKSPRARQGFPFVSLQAEVLARRYDAASRVSAADPLNSLPAETLKDHGSYTQLSWGIRPRLVAAWRTEAVRGAAAAFVTPERQDRVRHSTNLTWFPSEFSKLRFQYNYDRRVGRGTDHSLWAQFEFLLGAHAAHKF